MYADELPYVMSRTLVAAFPEAGGGVYILKYIYVCLHVCMYVCMYVCIYTTMNTFVLSVYALPFVEMSRTLVAAFPKAGGGVYIYKYIYLFIYVCIYVCIYMAMNSFVLSVYADESSM